MVQGGRKKNQAAEPGVATTTTAAAESETANKAIPTTSGPKGGGLKQANRKHPKPKLKFRDRREVTATPTIQLGNENFEEPLSTNESRLSTLIAVATLFERRPRTKGGVPTFSFNELSSRFLLLLLEQL